MKKSVLLLLLCFPLGHAANAENILTKLENSPAALAACGPENPNSVVDWHPAIGTVIEKSQVEPHPLPGKSLVYFFSDADQSWNGAIFSNRIMIGVDGKWVGGTTGTSFFSVDLPPGEHHLCSRLLYPFAKAVISLHTLNAEAGKTYFFTTSVLSDGYRGWFFHLSPSDPDQAAMTLEMVSAQNAAYAAWLRHSPRTRTQRWWYRHHHPPNPLKTNAFSRACGSYKTRFTVSRATSPTALTRPGPDQATVYLLLDSERVGSIFSPVVNVGLDGTWKGALRHRSYTVLHVSPGEHHLCLESPSIMFLRPAELEALHAQAGKTYFFHTLMLGAVREDSTGPIVLFVTPIDADAGRQFVATSYRSIAHEKSRKQQSAKAQRTPSSTKASVTK
jgi:hypothetical protein